MNSASDHEHTPAQQPHELRLLRRIAGDAPLREVLDDLCLTLQSLASRPLRCAVMIADAAGNTLRCLAAPSLPEEFRQKVAYPIRDGSSTCARAILTERPFIVADAQADETDENDLALYRQLGFGAIWSHPILQEDTALGTLAFLPDAPGTPSPQDAHLIEFGVQVARLALAHEHDRQALRQSEQRFRDFTDLSVDWYWEQDAGFRFTEVTYGSGSRPASPPYYDRDVVGKQRWDLPYVNVPEGFWDEHRRQLAAGESFSSLPLQRQTEDGIRHVEISGRPLFDEEGRLAGYRGVGRDITAHVTAEEKAAEATEWLQLAARAAHIGLWERDPDTWEFRYSSGWNAQFGYQAGELENSIESFDRLVHPDDLDRIHAFARAYAADPQGDYENEFRLKHKDGTWHWVLSRGALVTDAATGKRRWLGCHVDITEHKQMQEALRAREEDYRELNATLEERVKARTAGLEAANRELDAFNHSVSHDLRAPLRSVHGFSHALLEDYPQQLDDTGRDYLQRVCAAALRMGDLIDAMYHLSKLSRSFLQIRPVDLSARALAIADELRQNDPGRAAEFVVAPGIAAEGDPGLLGVLLANLLGNAWKYTARAQPARIAFFTETGEAGETVYCIRDNGAGFDMLFADKLFKLFQRLHREEDFRGHGVGLTTVQRIVRRHGGRIWAEGRKGEGAVFSFTLWEDAALRRPAETDFRRLIA